MKILQLVKKFPFPPKDGESIAVLSSSKGYADLGCEISLLSMNTKKHFVEKTEGEGLIHYKSIDTSYLDNTLNPIKAFLNLFSNDSFNIKRFDSSDFRHKLITILDSQDFDVIQLESLYMLPYINTIRSKSKAIIVFRSHNIEHEIWTNLSTSSNNPLLKWYYNLCSRRLKEYELNQFTNYDLLLPISHTDLSKYQQLGFDQKLLLSPVGIDIEKYAANSNVVNSVIKLGYIGSLDWKPNIEGLNWFFKNIWNAVSVKYNKIEFHLAGRNPDSSLQNLPYPKLFNHGEVPDAKDFLENLDFVVVPLLSGSGIRIKILESMAMGKVVLSTPKGYEGINIQNGRDGFIFNDAEEFEAQIQFLIENSKLISQISLNAKKYIKCNFDIKTLAQNNINKFKQIINSNG